MEDNTIDETTGETVTITTRIYQDVHDAYGIKAASQNTDTTNRVPKNANSVILQVTHDGELTMKTGNDFSSLDITILQTTGAGCDVVELPLYPGVEIYSEVTTRVTVQKNDEEETEQSTVGYSPKSVTTKSFIYDVTSSSNFTIKLLGYRV